MGLSRGAVESHAVPRAAHAARRLRRDRHRRAVPCACASRWRRLPTGAAPVCASGGASRTHLRDCAACRRTAVTIGLDDLALAAARDRGSALRRVAGLLPLPAFLRRRMRGRNRRRCNSIGPGRASTEPRWPARRPRWSSRRRSRPVEPVSRPRRPEARCPLPGGLGAVPATGERLRPRRRSTVAAGRQRRPARARMAAARRAQGSGTPPAGGGSGEQAGQGAGRGDAPENAGAPGQLPASPVRMQQEPWAARLGALGGGAERTTGSPRRHGRLGGRRYRRDGEPNRRAGDGYGGQDGPGRHGRQTLRECRMSDCRMSSFPARTGAPPARAAAPQARPCPTSAALGAAARAAGADAQCDGAADRSHGTRHPACACPSGQPPGRVRAAQ